MDDMRDFEQRVAAGLNRLVGPPRSVDATAIAHSTLTMRRPRRLAILGSVGTAAAAATVALAAGLVALGWLSAQEDGRSSVGVQPTHALTLGPEAPAAQSIVWDASAARLEADSLELRSNGRVILTGADPVVLEADARQPAVRSLRITWVDRYDAFLEFHLKRDEQSWWVRGLNFHDSSDNIWFHKIGSGKLWSAPLGQSIEVVDARFEGDRYTPYGPGGVPVELTIDDLQLTAFLPGTGATGLTDCRPPTEELYMDVLGGADSAVLAALSPAEAEAHLRDLGVCHEYRFERGGTWETWCTAPLEGQFESVSLFRTEEKEEKPDRLIVYYHDSAPGTGPQRTQPPEGWNCLKE